MIEFEIEGIPVPKGRPRFSRQGRSVHTYTPKETKAYESWFITNALPFKPAVPLFEPVALDVRFFMPAPQNMVKLRRELVEQEVLPVIVKPDLDNLLKGVMDAMNKVFWMDDKQIYSFSSQKYYSLRPRIVVRITKRTFILGD